MSTPLLVTTGVGLYCAAGDFHVDPWRPVPKAIVTHAHSDHACWGCGQYVTTREGEHVLRARVGHDAQIHALDYGEVLDVNGAKVSLHPAGHILGSAQIRIESQGEVWVASGDYKVEPDPTCTTFEPIRCHTFISESTFALPIYRWAPQPEIWAEINAWWRGNLAAGKASMLYGYALGKAQRMLAGIDPTIGPIYTHGAVEKLNRAYRLSGIALPETQYFSEAPKGTSFRNALVVAPPSAHGTPWSRRFAPSSSAFASGWMTIRGTRRRKAVDRGFVLSDHADWPGLLGAIAATGAERVILTHGYTAVLGRWLAERGLNVESFATGYRGESDGEDPATEDPEAAQDESLR